MVARTDQARAAAYLARASFEIVKAAAARRQRQGEGLGARLPAALAGASADLAVVRGGPGGRGARITPLGYTTAKRALPPILARLEASDPRLAAARFLGDAMERVGAIKGTDLAGSDSKAGLSDGGATTRVKHAARLRLVEALANRWPIDARHGPRPHAHRVIMTVKRASEKRRNIRAFDALVAMCVDGASVDAILRAHGWSPQAFNRNPLREALLEALDDVAQGLGLGRSGNHAGLDRA